MSNQILENFGNNPVIRLGTVVNVQDPLRNFRAQVRLYGTTDDVAAIPDSDLPWYTPLFPVTSPSLAGAGSSSGLEVNSRVMCLIIDWPNCQEAFILGSHYPGQKSK